MMLTVPSTELFIMKLLQKAIKMKKYLWLWAAISLVACKGNAGKNEEGIVENQPKNIQHADSSSVEVQDSTLIAAIAKGKEVYAQNCVVCHQSGGGGVPNMNPPLKETEYVLGEKKELISIILKGSSAGLEVNGQTYSNNMPAFSNGIGIDIIFCEPVFIYYRH